MEENMSNINKRLIKITGKKDIQIGITIPLVIAREFNINVHDEVEIWIQNDVIMIKKIEIDKNKIHKKTPEEKLDEVFNYQLKET